MKQHDNYDVNHSGVNHSGVRHAKQLIKRINIK